MTDSQADNLPAPFPPVSDADRAALHEFARRAPLTYGSWGRLKRIYKNVETNPLADPALFGLLAARMDAAPLSAPAIVRPIELGGRAHGIAAVAAAGESFCCLLGYSGQANEFAAFRVQPSDLLAPQTQGRFSLRSAHSLVSCGPYICVLQGGGETGSVGVFDVSDPLQPRWRGRVELGGYVRAAGALPYLYTAIAGAQGSFSGLRVVDLTDPDQPRVVGEVAVREARAVAANSDGLAVVVSGQSGQRWNPLPQRGELTIVDVHNPRAPYLLGSLALDDPKAVTAAETLAYVGIGVRGNGQRGSGLSIVDMADPMHPRLLSFVAMGQPKAIVLQAGFAFVVLEYGMVQVVDVRDPVQPTVTAHLPAYSASDIAVSGNTLYVSLSYNSLELYSIADPAKPSRIGSSPRGATFGYMKRRARRFLRKLAAKDADAYVRLAYETLAAQPAATLDTAGQWVSADILYGGSDRLTQQRHGRGPLIPTLPPRLRLKTREERAPDAWDRHPELTSALLTGAGLPWQTREAAFKMLQAANALPSEVSPDVLEAFLSSASPLLIRFATRQIAARTEGQDSAPQTMARAYFQSGQGLRRALEPALLRRVSDAAWGSAFAEQMLRMAGQNVQNGKLTRRAATALEAVARHFAAQATIGQVEALLAPLLNAGRPRLTTLVVTVGQHIKSAPRAPPNRARASRPIP